jgi:hypothetical protein
VPITLSLLAVVDVVVVPVVVVLAVVVVVGKVVEEGGATSYKILKCVMIDLADNISKHQHRR